ncbi:FUN14 family-domain-containing protein [Gaertneriomyces semiglobifer]|nr:FUN14 family-domain-containing protein [Gaertneriomyces semiglobifer]
MNRFAHQSFRLARRSCLNTNVTRNVSHFARSGPRPSSTVLRWTTGSAATLAALTYFHPQDTETALGGKNMTAAGEKVDRLPLETEQTASKLADGAKMTAFGTGLGFCAGYFSKKIGKVVMFFVGGVFVLMQFFVHQGYVTISWSRIFRGFQETAHKQGLEKATGEAASTAAGYGKTVSKNAASRVVGWLTKDVPFTTGFVGGFWVGMRYG